MPTPESRPAPSRLAPQTLACFVLLLLLSAGVSVVWSHYKLFWTDEFLEYFSDAKPSVLRIVIDQYRAPFSLEPPFFHILLHLLERVIPQDKFAARLPSMLSLLLIQASVFFIARRVSRTDLTGLVAMALPFYFVTLDYAVEARVYGLLAGCFALALLCWQSASIANIDGRHRNSRTLALAGLAGSLGIAMLAHFYGVFLAIPLWCAELGRSVERRRIDWPVLGALLGGTSLLLLDLPYIRALAPFRQHYYNTGETAWSNIGFTYLWFWDHFFVYHHTLLALARGEWIATALAFLLIGISVWRIKRQWRTPESFAGAEIAFSVTAFLPVLNLVAAQFTKAYVPRYSLPAVVGIAILIALTVNEIPGLRRVQVLLVPLAAVLALSYGRHEISRLHAIRDAELSSLRLSPEQRQALLQSPDNRIYVQNVAKMMFLHYYAPPELKSAITGTYSVPCDLRWTGRDPASLFARNMQATGVVPFVPFSELQQRPGPHLLAIYHDPGEEWIEDELHAEHALQKPLGPALGADLVSVSLDPAASCAAPAATEKSQ